MPEPYGIYEGTIGEQEYAHGRDEGRLMADALAEAQAPAWGGAQADGRVELEAAMSERTRAYWLGWLRGFREVSR